MADQSKPKQTSLSTDTLWWVGFNDDTENNAHWWDIFTCPQFRHVFMYARATDDTCVLISSNPGGLPIRHLKFDALEQFGYIDIHEYMRETFKTDCIIPVIAPVAGREWRTRIAPFTCVELARMVLCIDPWVFTPKQLYNYLVDHRLQVDLHLASKCGKM